MTTSPATSPDVPAIPDRQGGDPVGTPFAVPPGLGREYLLYHRVCPLRICDGKLEVAVAEGSVVDALDDLELTVGMPLTVRMHSAEDVDHLIERLMTGAEAGIDVVPGDADLRVDAEIRDLTNEPPVVRYVNLLIREAFESSASDVHLESGPRGLHARLRLDGILVDAIEPPARFEQPVISRVKLLANMDIANRRQPQDGRIRVRLNGQALEMRVSTVPTLYGESVVLRLLERAGRQVASLENLGLSGRILADMRRVATRHQGMVLVTGPTGSGKTTTLYAALALRNASQEKIITVEDPIEHSIEGVIQVPVHAPANVTFASVLRSILRQDPDVLMIGEMRDAETAEMAVKAALTGHVIFSTLHTSGATGAITRLLDMGLEPFIVAGTLDAVLAQRLVRRICGGCRSHYRPPLIPPDALLSFQRTGRDDLQLTHGVGCQACRRTGYRGRVGLFELLVVTPALRRAIADRSPPDVIEHLATEGGMVTLREDGWIKVQQGDTTVEEVLRVTT